MKFILPLIALSLIILPSYASAQLPFGKAGEISVHPICSHIINRSSVSINGTIETMPQTVNGQDVHFTSNFKLAPTESKEFCASGPFYAEQRLDLTIRSLFPLFSCRTKIDRDIYLDMVEEDDGTKTYSATCR